MLVVDVLTPESSASCCLPWYRLVHHMIDAVMEVPWYLSYFDATM